VPFAVVFGYKWLARDEPNASYACGSGSRGGRCFSGEITNMVLTFVWAGIALLAIVGLVMMVRSRRRTEQQHHGGQGSFRAFTVVHGRGNPVEFTFAPGTPGLVGGSQPSAALRLQQLDMLRAAGAISDAEYLRQREQVIAEV
jgi:hypothetical protein